MKSEDLGRVNVLMEKLGDRNRHYKMLQGLLKTGSYSNKLRLDIGGDYHGNGRYKSITVNIQDVKYVVDLIKKESAEEWTEIVKLRAKLRELGVELS